MRRRNTFDLFFTDSFDVLDFLLGLLFVELPLFVERRRPVRHRTSSSASPAAAGGGTLHNTSRRRPLLPQRCDADHAGHVAPCLCELTKVVFESGYHGGEVADGEESLLSQQGVSRRRLPGTGGRSLLRAGLSGGASLARRRYRPAGAGVGCVPWGSRGRQGSLTPVKFAPWSDENLTMEGSSWYISGFEYTSVAFMEASDSCLVFWR